MVDDVRQYMATKRFLAMERRLMSNKALATEYESS